VDVSEVELQGAIMLFASIEILAYLLIGSAAGQFAPPDKGDDAITAAVAADLVGVADASLVQVDTASAEGDEFSLELLVDDERSMVLDCWRHSIRSADFTVIGTLPNGTAGPIDPGPVRTFRCDVAGHPDAVVSGISRPGLGVTALIRLDDLTALELQPLKPFMKGAPENLHVLYDSDAVLKQGGACGTEEDGQIPQEGALAAACPSDGPFAARLAADTDDSYVTSFIGSRPEQEQQALDAIEFDINNVNAVYTRDLNTHHDLAIVVLRNPANDLYTSIDGETLLVNLITYWQAHPPAGGPVDASTLFINHFMRNFNGDALAGIAYLHSMCSPGPSVVLGRGSLVYRTEVISHELGHVWGARHCNDPSNEICGGNCLGGMIMRSSISSSPDPRFAPCSISEIAYARTQYVCTPDNTLIRPTVALLGPGGGPVAEGATITFGPVAVGQNADRTFRITNPNGCDLSVGVFFSSAPGFTNVSGGGNSTIPAGSFRDVTYRFTSPTPLHSVSSFSIQFPQTAMGGNFVVNMIGDAVQPPPAAPLLSCPLNGAHTAAPSQTTFSWSAASGASTYQFLLGGDPTFQTVMHQSAPLTGTSYTPSVTIPFDGKDLYWKVRAINASGSADSAVRTITPTELLLPHYRVLLNGQEVEWDSTLAIARDRTVQVRVENLWPNAITVRFNLPNFLQGQTVFTIPPCGAATANWQYVAQPPPVSCGVVMGNADWTGITVKIRQRTFVVHLCPQ
jgi:hypothetical protein